VPTGTGSRVAAAIGAGWAPSEQPAHPSRTVSLLAMASAAQPRQRTTRQRVAVAELLAESGEFRSAQDIHAALRARGASVGLATVYRNLGLMAELGEVDTLVRDDGETLYRQCSNVHHHHLVCRQCGRTVEIAGPAVEKWANTVAAAHGFSDVSHQLELFGLCAVCRDPG
jgi:Fur family transcriptional regulator, ferric uptake regulator